MEAQTRIAQLLASIDEAFDCRSWHGTNLRGSIRGLPRATARWRPAPGRHNIWEIVVHAAYWKYAVRRRLTGEKRGTFALDGSNFWRRPEEDSDAAWKRDVTLLVAEHTALREAIADFPAAKLARRAPGGKTAYEWLIRGIAAHDLYHAGQIQLLKRLATDAAR